jgi:hypothetical protein
MKAEHRKELQTNLLADRMGRLVQGMKTAPRSQSAIVWVLVGLGLATVIGWYIANATRGSLAAAWVQLEEQGTKDSWQAVQEKYPGTIAARTARFQEARSRLQEGLERIYDPAQRLVATYQLEAARKLFQGLAAECSGNPILEAEAIMGEAKAEETLAGAPKTPDNAEEGKGSLDKAIQLYELLAKKYANTFQGQMAEKHLKEIADNRTQVEGFYQEFRKRAVTAKRSEPSQP